MCNVSIFKKIDIEETDEIDMSKLMRLFGVAGITDNFNNAYSSSFIVCFYCYAHIHKNIKSVTTHMRQALS